MRIAILGAQGTGKTSLAQALVAQLRNDVTSLACVPAPLQEQRHTGARRTSSQELASRVKDHLAYILHHTADTLVCDTAPLQWAVYSEVVLGNTALYPWAVDQHQAFALTVLTGMDWPSNPSAPHAGDSAMRAHMDQRLREVLLENRIAFSTAYGSTEARAQQVRLSVLRANGSAPDTPASNWKWSCEKCSDAECEHQMFSKLLTAEGAGVDGVAK